MESYVRDYFDDHAEAWLEQAYQPGALPPAFPVGEERIRLALAGNLCRCGCYVKIVEAVVTAAGRKEEAWTS